MSLFWAILFSTMQKEQASWARARSIHNAYKIDSCLMAMVVHDNSSKDFWKVEPKTDHEEFWKVQPKTDPS